MRSERFRGWRGIELRVHEVGAGRPLILLHGFLGDARSHWIEPGHAALLAARGHRVVMPDLRGHGESAKPHDSALYPPDVLVEDALALIDHLGLEEFDLGGYSLGARTALRTIVRGARPGRAVVAGMGLEALTHRSGERTRFYREILTRPGTFERGSPQWKAERFVRSSGDPAALAQVLDCSLDTPSAAIAAIEVPTLALVGTEDHAHASAAQLADLLPGGELQPVPGSHGAAILAPQLGAAIASFLDPAPESR